MLTKIQYDSAKARALEYYKKAGIVISEKEIENLEVSDFGLNELDDMARDHTEAGTTIYPTSKY